MPFGCFSLFKKHKKEEKSDQLEPCVWKTSTSLKQSNPEEDEFDYDGLFKSCGELNPSKISRRPEDFTVKSKRWKNSYYYPSGPSPTEILSTTFGNNIPSLYYRRNHASMNFLVAHGFFNPANSAVTYLEQQKKKEEEDFRLQFDETKNLSILNAPKLPRKIYTPLSNNHMLRSRDQSTPLRRKLSFELSLPVIPEVSAPFEREETTFKTAKVPKMPPGNLKYTEKWIRQQNAASTYTSRSLTPNRNAGCSSFSRERHEDNMNFSTEILSSIETLSQTFSEANSDMTMYTSSTPQMSPIPTSYTYLKMNEQPNTFEQISAMYGIVETPRRPRRVHWKDDNFEETPSLRIQSSDGVHSNGKSWVGRRSAFRRSETIDSFHVDSSVSRLLRGLDLFETNSSQGSSSSPN